MGVEAPENLQAAIDRVGNAVDLLRNGSGRAFSHGAGGFVPAQFTNWQSEARSWHESCAFLDQSHHMNDLYVTGPDAKAVLERLGVNTFANFEPDQAKQFVAVNHEGDYIGDCILFYLEPNSFNLVGRRTVLDWVRYNVETGGWNAAAEFEGPSYQRPGVPPKVYRYELQGPATGAIMEKLVGTLPDVKFFKMTSFDFGGHRVRALRHGMAGQVGYEFFGPWSEAEAVRDVIFAAGEEFGITRTGSIAYSTSNLESGWIPGPTPAIFSDPGLKGYREWLPAASAGQLAGSLYSTDIRDYYYTPFELGYGKTVKFDHDFVGSDALKARADQPRRTKVTLVWEPEDVTRVVSSLWNPGPTYKRFDIPKARYGMFQSDEVLVDGRRVGVSTDCGYIVSAKSIVSLAIIDQSLATPGTSVEVVWGENPVSGKPDVEPHEQTRIRATVAPAPYDQFARDAYREARAS